jgi:hypothetical protein
MWQTGRQKSAVFAIKGFLWSSPVRGSFDKGAVFYRLTLLLPNSLLFVEVIDKVC